MHTRNAGDRQLRTEYVRLTARQREVLELIARGHTNGEIAERLGISLDGAKYHVSEILGELGVEAREEAGDWWRGQRGPRVRLGQMLRGFAAIGLMRIAAGGAAIAAAGGVLAIPIALRTLATETGDPPLTATLPVTSSPTEDFAPTQRASAAYFGAELEGSGPFVGPDFSVAGAADRAPSSTPQRWRHSLWTWFATSAA